MIDVARLATLVRKYYSPETLDTGVTEPTIVEYEDGFRAVVLPQAEMFEPWRSFRLIDAAAVGTTLVITFWWDDGTDEETIYLMPLDTRDADFDVSDESTATTYLSHSIEFAIGGSRESWEAACTTPFSPRFAVVRPYQRV